MAMNDKTKGIVLMIVSSFFFAVMAALVKAVPHLTLAQKLFFRNIFGVVFLFGYMIRKKIPFIGKNFKLLMLRSIFGLAGVGLYYYSINLLPLSDATMLHKMSQAFTLVLSIMFLKEKTNKFQIISMVTAIIGAAFIIKPQFNYTVVPALIALLSAITSAAAYVVVRELRKYAPPETIVFNFSLFTSLVTIHPMFYNYTDPAFNEWWILIAIGISATIAQMTMTVSYKYAAASETAVYGYSQIVFTALLGIMLWKEIPDILSTIGGLLIIASGIVNYVGEKRLNKDKMGINGNN